MNVALTSALDYSGSSLIVFNQRESKRITEIVRGHLSHGNLDYSAESLREFGLDITKKSSIMSEESPLEFKMPLSLALKKRTINVEIGDAVVRKCASWSLILSTIFRRFIVAAYTMG